MLSLTSSVCIDAPAEAVWAALARIEDIPLWSTDVVTASCPVGHERGVGAQRICHLRGGIELTEIWTSWEDGHTFTYEGQGVPLLRLARNTWTVTPEGTRTLLTSNAEVTVNGGRLGRLLEPLMAWQGKRMGNRTLNAFASLVNTRDAAKPHRNPRVTHPVSC